MAMTDASTLGTRVNPWSGFPGGVVVGRDIILSLKRCLYFRWSYGSCFGDWLLSRAWGLRCALYVIVALARLCPATL